MTESSLITQTYFLSFTLIITRNAIEMSETVTAQMFVSVMCRQISTIVRGTTKFPSGRSITIPSSNGIWKRNINLWTACVWGHLMNRRWRKYGHSRRYMLHFTVSTGAKINYFEIEILKNRNVTVGQQSTNCMASVLQFDASVIYCLCL